LKTATSKVTLILSLALAQHGSSGATYIASAMDTSLPHRRRKMRPSGLCFRTAKSPAHFQPSERIWVVHGELFQQ
jgi:hypothetical protein